MAAPIMTSAPILYSKAFALRLGAVAVLAVLWQTASYVSPGEGRIVPSLWAILTALFVLIAEPSTYAHIFITTSEIVAAILLGTGAAAAVLLISTRSATLVGGLAALLYWLAPTPKIIFFPVALGLFGVDYGSKIAIGALSVFFPVALSLLIAVRQIPIIYMDVARSFGLGAWQIVTKVYVPCLWTAALTGIRLGAGLGIIGVLLAETKLSNRGLGHLAVQYYSAFKIKELYAVLIITFVLAALLNLLISRIEDRRSVQA